MPKTEIDLLNAKITELESENDELKQNLQKSNTAQIKRSKIYNFLATVLKTDVSSNVLVDVELGKADDHQLIILGRPPVLGSSTKQMRHVTPYSFVEHVIKSRINNADSKTVMLKDLAEPIKLFTYSQKGICLLESQYQKFKDSIKSTTDDFFYIKMATARNIYYFIDQAEIPLEWKTTTILNSIDKENAKSSYVPKLQKFVNYAINHLQEAIQDENTIGIACEALARFILTLFNQKLYTAFPEEGNTLPYEIRLYKSEQDAKAPKGKEWVALTHAEIETKSRNATEYMQLSKKLRIVNNEGSTVTKTIKSLGAIEEIIEQYNALLSTDAAIKEYNTKYNSILKILSIPVFPKTEYDKYNKTLTKSNITSLCHYHIAKHLYFVFDFKSLEEKVFVPTKSSDTGVKITIYPSADGDRTATYCIKDGATYRKDQINSASGYNKQVIFRSEMLDKSLLREKVLDHVYMSIMSFFHFKEGLVKRGASNDSYPKSILEAFSKIVEHNHRILPQEKFVDKLKELWDNKNFFRDVEGELVSSSEVEEALDQSFEVINLIG